MLEHCRNRLKGITISKNLALRQDILIHVARRKFHRPKRHFFTGRAKKIFCITPASYCFQCQDRTEELNNQKQHPGTQNSTQKKKHLKNLFKCLQLNLGERPDCPVELTPNQPQIPRRSDNVYLPQPNISIND